MSLESLQERLAALQETTSQLKELIDRLASLKFQPGSVPLNIEEEGSVSGELSAEISTILRGGLEDQQLLCEEAKYVRPEGHEKTRLQDGIERVGGELSSYRSVLRKARLSAKTNLERAQRLERELMIQSFVETVSVPTTPTIADRETAAAPIPRYSQQHQSLQSSLSEKDRQTVNASSNLTNALQRTHALMTAELTRSEFAHQMLAESSEALSKLDESYTSLDGMLANSRDLLGTLMRSQKSDTWYLQTARYILLATFAWLVFRRLIYGPAWWLVWLPLRMIFGVGIKAGGAVMQVGGGGGRGESGSVGVGDVSGKVSVDGLPDESLLPTAKIQGEGDDTAVVVVVDGSDTDAQSMMEKVGRIVDAAREANELGSIPAEDEPGEPGEVKEEREEVGGNTRPRDEL